MPLELKLCQGFQMYGKSMDKQFINKLGNQSLDEDFAFNIRLGFKQATTRASYNHNDQQINIISNIIPIRINCYRHLWAILQFLDNTLC